MTLVAPYTKNTILLRGEGDRHEEYPVGVAFKPGHLLEMYNVAGVLKVKKHSTAGGRAGKWFAMEDALQGKWLDDLYVVDTPAAIHMAEPGDMVQGRVAAGAVAITEADWLISAGDGTLQKTASLGTHVLSALTADGSAISPADTNPTSLGHPYVMPPNTLQAGDLLHIHAEAISTQATNSTNTLAFTLKVGSTTLIATPAVDAGANDLAVIDFWLHCRSVGAGGKSLGSGTASFGATTVGTARVGGIDETTLDTTVAQTFDVLVTASAANAANEGKLLDFTVEMARVSPQELLFQALETLDNSGGGSEALIAVLVL